MLWKSLSLRKITKSLTPEIIPGKNEIQNCRSHKLFLKSLKKLIAVICGSMSKCINKIKVIKYKITKQLKSQQRLFRRSRLLRWYPKWICTLILIVFKSRLIKFLISRADLVENLIKLYAEGLLLARVTIRWHAELNKTKLLECESYD